MKINPKHETTLTQYIYNNRTPKIKGYILKGCILKYK